jgi:phosphoserine phosphatase RsbU/P
MLTHNRPDPVIAHLQAEVESLRRAVAELTVLNDISREIGALADLDAVLRRIVERSVAALNAEEGLITLVEDTGEDVGTTLVRSLATSADRTPFHLNEHIVGWMQLHHRPLRVSRPADDPRLQFITSDDDIEALLSVPLLVRAHLIGVLTVINCKDGDSFSEADQRLLSIIGIQSAQIIDNARLYEEEKRLLTMQEDLRVASEIQKRLLPDAPIPIPSYELAGRMIPAHQVGGDFFDFLPLGTSRTALCVGDVSGKGLPASLLMASALATIRAQADPERAPAKTMARVNQQIYRSVRRGNFLTLFYGELWPDEHRFRYVNAGHNRPLLLRQDGTVQELREGGVAIGMLPAADYEEGEVDFQRGDVLLIFSDGVIEAENALRQPFGDERLVEALREHARLPAEELVAAVVERIRAFTGDAPPFDDITLLALARA